MYFAPVPETNPPTGGRWQRDPLTGALTPIDEPTEPQPTPEE